MKNVSCDNANLVVTGGTANCGAASDDKVGFVATLSFQCLQFWTMLYDLKKKNMFIISKCLVYCEENMSDILFSIVPADGLKPWSTGASASSVMIKFVPRLYTPSALEWLCLEGLNVTLVMYG